MMHLNNGKDGLNGENYIKQMILKKKIYRVKLI